MFWYRIREVGKSSGRLAGSRGASGVVPCGRVLWGSSVGDAGPLVGFHVAPRMVTRGT